MSEIESIADELFFKLRNRFPRIQMGDESGQSTSSPSDGRFFNFDYIMHGNAYGTVTCSLIDNQVLKVFFSQDITEQMDEHTEEDWFQLLRELRKFAKSHMLMFDVRDITKDTLDQKDIEFVSQYHKEKSEVSESRVLWNRRGRFSEGNQESIRIHVVHKNKLEENPNNRLSQIDKIYLVNSKQERFLMPFTSVTGAKAMAHHTAKGGTPYDEGGLVIGRAVAEMKNLQRFALSNRNRQFESEDPQRVLEAIKHIREAMRGHVLKMAENRDFDEHLTELTKLTKLSDARVNEDIKGWFMQNTFNENYDAWIESAANAYHKYEEMMMNETNDDGIPSKDMTDVRRANPAKVGNTVQLYMDPNKDKEMQELIRSQPMRGMVRLILADIAKRAVDDEVAILASKADEGEMTQRHLAMIKSYIHDLYSGNPDRTAPAAKKDIHGKAKSPEEEFESTIMGMGEAEQETDEGNAFSGAMAAARAAGHDHFEVDGKHYEVTDEGNAFSGAMAAARAAGHDHFEVDGKHYAVTNEGSCNMTAEGTMCPMHGMNECGTGMYEEGQLDELSPETLGSYINKAGSSMARAAYNVGDKGYDSPQSDVDHKTIGKRAQGIKLATDKLMPGIGGDVDEEAEVEMRRKMHEEIAELRRLSGLAEQNYVSTAPSNPNNPIDQASAAMRNQTPAQHNARVARNDAAERAFYAANPNLVGDTATMQNLRDRGKLNFNPGTLSKGFDGPEVDPSRIQNRAAVDAARQQRNRDIDAAQTQDAIGQIRSKPAWSPGDEPWPGANAPAAQSKPAVAAPPPTVGPDAEDKPYSPPLYIKPMSESDSLTSIMKLAGLRK